MRQVYFIFFFLAILAIALGLIFGLKDGTIEPEVVRWVAGGTGDSPLLQSSDGINWKSGSGVDIDDLGQGVGYGLSSDLSTGIWAANIAGEGRGIVYSLNGRNWKNSTGISSNWNALYGGPAYGLSSDKQTGIWVSGSNFGRSLIFSLDGQSWKPATGASFGLNSSGYPITPYGVAYGLSANGTSVIWVANGNNGKILYSLDGQSWQPSRGTSFTESGYGVAYGLSSNGTSGIWVAVGSGSDSLLYSLDGQSWQPTTGASFGRASGGYGVAYGLSAEGTSLWVATGGDAGGGGIFLYSLDGQSWRRPENNFPGANGWDVAYGFSSNGTSGIWVANTHNDGLLHSLDGQCWKQASGASFNIGFAVGSNRPNPALVGTDANPFA